ncbi:MAG: efflux RND transporter periplasmic adaptor subunit [Candidatus Hydrogenedentes bacterium]|nr:efflux RND transporter periplasmic adaptor subunit [Candidatus Hydrogenedentota bacterium]
MRKALITGVVCVVIVAMGWAVVMAAISSARETDPTGPNHAERVPNVKVKVVATEELRDRLELTGTVYPWQDVTVSAEVGGKIEWKGVEVGQEVKQGQELYRVDSMALQAALDQAEAQSRLASQEFERTQRLLDRGVSTKQNEDSAVANRDVSSASLRAMQIQLEKSVVKAPFDAIVDRVFQEQDEYADVGKPLVRLVQLHRVKIKVGIPERDIPYFKAGDEVALRLDAYPEQTFQGSIHTITPTADLATHTFTAEIAVENPDSVLKPGMIARVELVRQVYPESIVVPIFAAILLDDQRFVLVERDGVAELRPVEVGVIQGNNVQITSGLAPGDHLIVVGQRDVSPGEPVSVQETLQ